MKIIFLDIDGVLNAEKEIVELTPMGYRGLDDRLIKNLKLAVDKTDAKIVLTSTWKVEWKADKRKCGKDSLYLIRKFETYGLKIVGKTIDNCVYDPFYEHRGEGIKAYLLGRNDIENYVIIDDNVFSDFDDEIKKHLVKTNSDNGLTYEKANEVINILETL